MRLSALALALVALAPVVLASHEDGTYEIPIVPVEQYRPKDLVYDVFLDLPTDNYGIYRRAIEATVVDFGRGIEAFGRPELTSKFEMRVFVVGRDVPPADALASPDVLIVADDVEKAGILGVTFRGLMLARSACVIDVGQQWNGYVSGAAMYNIAGHELGHCLGLDHVTSHPEHDLMYEYYTHPTYDPTTHRHCVSTLDVKGVEAATQHLWGSGYGPDWMTQPVGEYQTLAC